eukprot:gene17669-19431_t
MEDLRRVSNSLKQRTEKGISAEDQKSLLNLENEDFQGVILDVNDASHFKEVILKCNENAVKALILKVMADLAKKDENRTVLVKAGVIPVLMNEIENDNYDVTLQCFRTIDDGQQAVLESGGIGKVMDKFKNMAELSDKELGNLPAMAYGCVNNISDDNVSLQEEFVKQGAMQIFLNCVKTFVNRKSEMAVLVIRAICALACSASGIEQFIELNIVAELLSFVKDADEKIIVAIFDSITELIEEDELSDEVCKEKSLLVIMDAAESRPNFNETDNGDKVLKKIIDSLVLFTSNESFHVKMSDTKLLDRFLAWLRSPNKQINVSAALAIGNCARSDGECIELVKNDTHKKLIDFLSDQLEREDTTEQQQAVLSALKNMSIPVANKPILIDAMLPDCACRAVKLQNAAVQFKGLAVLRLLVQEQTGLAVRLGQDENLLAKIDECAKQEYVVGLCAEARRLTAAIVKNCHSNDCMQSLLNHNAMEILIGLLGSDHMIMQNEGLVSIVTLMTCGQDAVDKFLDANGVEKTAKMLNQSSSKPHLVFNLISLFTAICQTENGKKALKESDILKDLEKLACSPNEMVQSRSTELLNLLKA